MSCSARAQPAPRPQAPDVIVKPGATIDVSGGWTTYQAGLTLTTELIDSAGHIVPIGQADPNVSYVAIAKPFQTTEPASASARPSPIP